MSNVLNDEQRAAVAKFAAANGRYWKRKLGDLWANGRDSQQADGPLLRQVRNDFGPSWLKTFKL